MLLKLIYGFVFKTIYFLIQTITALTCFEHRGGCSADKISGDGAGIMS